MASCACSRANLCLGGRRRGRCWQTEGSNHNLVLGRTWNIYATDSEIPWICERAETRLGDVLLTSASLRMQGSSTGNWSDAPFAFSKAFQWFTEILVLAERGVCLSVYLPICLSLCLCLLLTPPSPSSLSLYLSLYLQRSPDTKHNHKHKAYRHINHVFYNTGYLSRARKPKWRYQSLLISSTSLAVY